jgi:hypothetical protein
LNLHSETNPDPVTNLKLAKDPKKYPEKDPETNPVMELDSEL